MSLFTFESIFNFTFCRSDESASALVNDFVNDFDGHSGEIVKKFKFLTDNDNVNNFDDFDKIGRSGEISRSGEIVKKFKFLTVNAMKLIEKRTYYQTN